MKIAFDGQLLLEENKTGIAWNAHNLLMELLKHPENECILQCFKDWRMDGQRKKLNAYRKIGCNIEYCSWFGYTLYKLAWIFFRIPYHFFFREKADITQFFNYAVPPGVKGKRVTFIYDMAYKAWPKTVSKKTKAWLELCMKKSCKHADCIVTISEFSKNEIAKYLKVPKERIAVVPCAVNHMVYHPGYTQEQIQNVRGKFGIGHEYFLYLGTIEPRKNLERVIGAYARLYRERSHVPQLVLAGKKGWLCRGIYEKVKKLVLGHKILFIGYVAQEDSPILMCGAKAFVFPSLYEGFGMPPLEAMACGTPVIASNTSSLPEVVGDAGIMVNPKSEEEICQAMQSLLEDEEYRKRLGMLGMARAQRYTWEKSAGILMDVYEALCNE